VPFPEILRAPKLSVLVLLISASGYSQQEADSTAPSPVSIAAYPYVFYTPESKFAFAGAVVGTFSRPGPLIKSSNAILSAYYTTNRQYDILFQPEWFLGEDLAYLTGTFDWGWYVDRFYGIGNSTPDRDDAAYTRKTLIVNAEAAVRIAGPLKLGVVYDLNSTSSLEGEDNPLLSTGTVTGGSGGFASGIGGVIFVDDRDHAFVPNRGGYIKLSVIAYTPKVGSDFQFTRRILDVRQYFQLSSKSVLAVQLYAASTVGTVPFYQLPALGGDKIMRGYYLGRYRDVHYVAVQLELRLRLANRWGMVVFGGIGDVASSPGGFHLPDFKPSLGIGLRFALDALQKLNVRADLAAGRGTYGAYFAAKEAF